MCTLSLTADVNIFIPYFPKKQRKGQAVCKVFRMGRLTAEELRSTDLCAPIFRSGVGNGLSCIRRGKLKWL